MGSCTCLSTELLLISSQHHKWLTLQKTWVLASQLSAWATSGLENLSGVDGSAASEHSESATPPRHPLHRRHPLQPQVCPD